MVTESLVSVIEVGGRASNLLGQADQATQAIGITGEFGVVDTRFIVVRHFFAPDDGFLRLGDVVVVECDMGRHEFG
jgi:hypothetical protein